MSVYKEIKVPERWLLHSYYTLCPYASDGSGRLLAAGANLDTRTGEVFILDKNGEVIDSFGEHPVESGFFILVSGKLGAPIAVTYITKAAV